MVRGYGPLTMDYGLFVLFAYEQKIPTSGKASRFRDNGSLLKTGNSVVYWTHGTMAPNLATTIIQMTRFFGPISFSCMINTNKEASESGGNVFNNTGVRK